MKSNRLIKKCVAVLLMLLFCISITPVVIFHNLLANHTDSALKNPDNGKEQVGKKLFNCHCDSIVAESPFTGTSTQIIQPPLMLYAGINSAKSVQVTSPVHLHSALRGPPTV